MVDGTSLLRKGNLRISTFCGTWKWKPTPVVEISFICPYSNVIGVFVVRARACEGVGVLMRVGVCMFVFAKNEIWIKSLIKEVHLIGDVKSYRDRLFFHWFWISRLHYFQRIEMYSFSGECNVYTRTIKHSILHPLDLLVLYRSGYQYEPVFGYDQLFMFLIWTYTRSSWHS